jgi:hypothetical protein
MDVVKLKKEGREPVLVKSKMETMKKFAKLLRKHRDILMDWIVEKGANIGGRRGGNHKTSV